MSGGAFSSNTCSDKCPCSRVSANAALSRKMWKPSWRTVRSRPGFFMPRCSRGICRSARCVAASTASSRRASSDGDSGSRSPYFDPHQLGQRLGIPPVNGAIADDGHRHALAARTAPDHACARARSRRRTRRTSLPMTKATLSSWRRSFSLDGNRLAPMFRLLGPCPRSSRSPLLELPVAYRLRHPAFQPIHCPPLGPRHDVAVGLHRES